jgi:hypothetical protein
MKRTVVFPLMPGRDASKFDASQQLNLGLLHDPKRQGKSLVYDNIDPSYLKRKTACAADYNKPTVERFQEPAELRNEIREERLAMRDTKRLEALMERQQRRYEASMSTVLDPSVTSKKAVASTPKISFPKASRQVGNSPGPSASAGESPAKAQVTQSYSYLPRVTGAVDFAKGSMRDGKQPPRAASSLDGKHHAAQGALRSASVPADANLMSTVDATKEAVPLQGATLGDFMTPTAPLVEQHAQANPLSTHRTNTSRSPDGRSDGGDAPPAFFLSKRDQYALRDLPAPDLKRAAGRTKHISGTTERRQYRYEDVLSDTCNHLDVSAAHKVTQSSASGALPFSKAGRDPPQPVHVSKDDPLVKAARRVQDEITENLCPQYRIHLGKLRATKQRDKKRLAEQEDAALPSIFSEAPSPAPKPRHRAPRKEPLYTVGHGGGRLSMNLDVLFRGKRFKELLAMHDFMIDRELNGGGPVGHSAGGDGTTVSWDDEDVPSRRSHSPAALTITERMEQGLPVSFEEALAEAERRERLLQLRSLSLMKDNPAAVDPPRSDKRPTISFVSAPDRFGAGDKSELHDKAFEGLNHLMVEQHSPATAMIRSHMKLKQMYDTLHDEVGGHTTSEGRGASPKKDASMRRLSTLH